MSNNEKIVERLQLLMESEKFPPIVCDDFSKQLADKKKNRGYLTPPEFGKAAGVSPTSVKNWLYKGTVPNMSCLHKLSNTFGVSVEWILGQTETTNLETKVGYAAFEELGFSVAAYENLRILKNQGGNMKNIMSGINHLLEFAVQPHAHMSDLVEEYREQAENEETAEERQYLLDAAEKIGKEAVEISLPILEQLNKFFDLYKNGIYARIPLREVVKFRNQLNECKDNPDLLDQIPFWHFFKETISPAQNDSTALFEIENTLKEIKKQLIAQKKTALAKDPMFDKKYDSTWAGAMYQYGASQEYALELMSEFYNLDSKKK